MPVFTRDIQPESRDPSLFPFPLAGDPADAFNALAKAKGWKVDCDSRLEFEAGELNAMREVWRAHCRANRLPGRSEFSFRDLKPFLRTLTIIGIVPDGSRRRYMHRLVGSTIVRRIGEMTGKYLDEYMPAGIAEKISACFDTAIGYRCPLRFVIDFELPVVNYSRGELFIMPLAEDGTTPDLLFSLSHFTPRAGRLGIDAMTDSLSDADASGN